MLQSAQGVRSSTAGCYSHHDIFFVRLALGHVLASACSGIFAVFGGMTQGFIASGDYILDGPGIGIEGWRALGGIECGQASASARAYVNQPSTAANRIGNGVNGFSDLRQSLLYGGSYLVVFTVNDAGNFQRGKSIKTSGSNVLLLGSKGTEFGFAGASPVTSLVKGLNN